MKRQLKTLKGKRVVLTNNANEITRNEIGIIEKQDGTLEVKEHDANGNIENIAGGSSTEGIKEHYYTIDVQGVYDSAGGEDVLVLSMLVYANYIIIPDADRNKRFEQVLCSWKDYEVYTTKEVVAFRCIENIPIQIIANNKIYSIYGDNYTKIKYSSEILGMDYEMALNMISPYIKEITKEEYESLIEEPAIILGK